MDGSPDQNQGDLSPPKIKIKEKEKRKKKSKYQPNLADDAPPLTEPELPTEFLFTLN